VTPLELERPVRDDYAEFCDGVRRLTSIDLAQYRREQMERRIRSFARRRGIEALGEYLRVLRGSSEELDSFLDRVTINVSELWRNPEQWALLARAVLPELALTGQICAWSAGTSHGAEAYTLAAVARDAVPPCRITVRGTDIDRRMIARARQGWYSNDEVREADPSSLRRWFIRDGEGWRARPELASSTTFEVADLLRMNLPEAAYDLILCRNVVIYLTAAVRDDLHARLAGTVRRGGYMVIGSTERIQAPEAIGLEVAHPFVYRKL